MRTLTLGRLECRQVPWALRQMEFGGAERPMPGRSAPPLVRAAEVGLAGESSDHPPPPLPFDASGSNLHDQQGEAGPAGDGEYLTAEN
eukprot:7765023-Pyramimonas_sp.AAC.1